MEIVQPKIRFQHNQIVWINSQLKAKQFTCSSLKIICSYNGYGVNGWGVITHPSGGGMPYKIYYSEETYPKENQWVSEELLFETKEELLKSL